MSEICIIVTIVVYLAAMLLVGFAYSKTNNDSTDFYLGGRKMGPLVTAMSLSLIHILLRFENYCAQPVELGADGLPVHNAHGGYDLQGVQAAAQRHDGTMTLHWADGWFNLRILLPVPS